MQCNLYIYLRTSIWLHFFQYHHNSDTFFSMQTQNTIHTFNKQQQQQQHKNTNTFFTHRRNYDGSVNTHHLWSGWCSDACCCRNDPEQNGQPIMCALFSYLFVFLFLFFHLFFASLTSVFGRSSVYRLCVAHICAYEPLTPEFGAFPFIPVRKATTTDVSLSMIE